jgi:hypothetical protein
MTQASTQCRYTTIRIHDLELDHVDIKTAFLYGLLDKDIFMQQPPAKFIYESGTKEHLVCRLRKSPFFMV